MFNNSLKNQFLVVCIIMWKLLGLKLVNTGQSALVNFKSIGFKSMTTVKGKARNNSLS